MTRQLDEQRGNVLQALPEKFRSRFEVCDDTGCWVWTGATWGTPKLQYGRFCFDGASRQAHRVSYNLLIDPDFPISPGKGSNCQLDHVFGVCAVGPRCVNPWHVEPVTNRENSTRSANGGRSRTSSRFVGVTKHKSGWQAQIKLDGRDFYLGLWTSELTAAQAYDAACILAGVPPANFDRKLTSRRPSPAEMDWGRVRLAQVLGDRDPSTEDAA